MWFASNKGGEAYDRNNFIKHYIHTILFFNWNNYHCGLSISYKYYIILLKKVNKKGEDKKWKIKY